MFAKIVPDYLSLRLFNKSIFLCVEKNVDIPQLSPLWLIFHFTARIYRKTAAFFSIQIICLQYISKGVDRKN